MSYPSRLLGRDFRHLRREMDRLIQDFAPATAGDTEADQAVWSPRADLAETEDAYVISLDMPGVTPSALELTVEDDTVKVAGEREIARESGGQYHRIERSYGRFFRAFRFGGAIDAGGVTADFAEGVLTIRVPKAEASRPRRVEVRAAAGPSGSGDGA